MEKHVVLSHFETKNVIVSLQAGHEFIHIDSQSAIDLLQMALTVDDVSLLASRECFDILHAVRQKRHEVSCAALCINSKLAKFHLTYTTGCCRIGVGGTTLLMTWRKLLAETYFRHWFLNWVLFMMTTTYCRTFCFGHNSCNLNFSGSGPLPMPT